MRVLAGLNRTLTLLDGTRNRREDVIRAGADKPNRAYDDRQNDSQHDRILRNILSGLILPKTPPGPSRSDLAKNKMVQEGQIQAVSVSPLILHDSSQSRSNACELCIHHTFG